MGAAVATTAAAADGSDASSSELDMLARRTLGGGSTPTRDPRELKFRPRATEEETGSILTALCTAHPHEANDIAWSHLGLQYAI
mmetsp:Transcript_95471/g.275053  ORF Transcript_95471/g.275053 Transcript_95471/m.275053 type:complete len:84 (+) Transcript_95471:117-368(+)